MDVLLDTAKSVEVVVSLDEALERWMRRLRAR